MHRLTAWFAMSTATLISCFYATTTMSATFHPNHVTLTEMEFNPKTGNFEIALSVHPEDLEKELKALHEKISEGTEKFRLNESSIDRLAKKWLEQHFLMRQNPMDRNGEIDTKPLPIRWVGCELEIRKVWLFFEVQVKTDMKNFELENKLFLQSNDDQTNHVKFKFGQDLSWYKADKNTPKLPINLTKSTDRIPSSIGTGSSQ